MDEVASLHQFRHNGPAIVSGECSVEAAGDAIVFETDKASVLDAIPLGWRGGEDDAFGQLLFRVEVDFVVGPGKHPDPLGGVLVLLGQTIRQAELFGLQPGAKIVQTERVRQLVQHTPSELAVQSHFREAPPEQRLLVNLVWDLTRLGQEAAGTADLDFAVGMDDAASKRDGGDVTFSRGAQAENEPQRAGRQIRLVRMRNDGRVEQGCGFQRVFGQEVGADQKPPGFGGSSPGGMPSLTCSKRSRKSFRICRCRAENSAETASRSDATRSSGSDMIRVMIWAVRSGPPGLKGRRSTRAWSGLRTVVVRLTWTVIGRFFRKR